MGKTLASLGKMRIALICDLDQKKGTALHSQSHRLIERILLSCQFVFSVDLDKVTGLD